jgi:hypothetical protein
LFVVEFDGDAHSTETQRRRDAQKDFLCERFQFPLLRINSRYIHKRYRQMDLLSWFVNYWFSQRMIEEAYETGAIPGSADVDPIMFVSLPGTSRRFPLWLNSDVRIAFKRYHEQGKCIDSGPSIFVGSDETGAFRAIAYIAVTGTIVLFAETAMRAQRFNAPCIEIVQAIVDHQIYDQFVDLMKGRTDGLSLDTIGDEVRWYRQHYEWLTCGVGTQSKQLRAASAGSGSHFH